MQRTLLLFLYLIICGAMIGALPVNAQLGEVHWGRAALRTIVYALPLWYYRNLLVERVTSLRLAGCLNWKKMAVVYGVVGYFFIPRIFPRDNSASDGFLPLWGLKGQNRRRRNHL